MDIDRSMLVYLYNVFVPGFGHRRGYGGYSGGLGGVAGSDRSLLVYLYNVLVRDLGHR